MTSQRSGLRTQAVVIAAWAAGATALVTALYPVLTAALFAFLVGLVLVCTLRWSLRMGLLAGLVATAPFAFADRTLVALSTAQSGQDSVAHLVLGAALLVGSAVVADAASLAIARVPSETVAGRDVMPGGPRLLRTRDAGLRRAEWELARAAQYGRAMTLALIGPDVPAGGEPAEVREALMRHLDALVLEHVTPFDVLCEYGLSERLMVMPEESAADLGEHASQVCAIATDRLGREVRMALVAYPDNGSSLRSLLTELEIDLAMCRANGIAYQVCAVKSHGVHDEVTDPAEEPEPRLAVEQDDAPPTRPTARVPGPAPEDGAAMSA